METPVQLKGSTDKPSVLEAEKSDLGNLRTEKVNDVASSETSPNPSTKDLKESASAQIKDLIPGTTVLKTAPLVSNNQRKWNGNRSTVHKAQRTREVKRNNAIAASQNKTIAQLNGENDGLKEKLEELTSQRDEKETAEQAALDRDFADSVDKSRNKLYLQHGQKTWINLLGLAKTVILFIVMFTFVTIPALNDGMGVIYAALIVLSLSSVCTLMSMLVDLTWSLSSLKATTNRSRQLSPLGFREPYYFQASLYTYAAMHMETANELYGDVRSEFMQLKDLKHEDPLLTRIKCCIQYGPMLSFVMELVVSMELYAQITGTNICNPEATEENTKLRLHDASKNFPYINIDRYTSLDGLSVVFDTRLLALAYWKQTVERRSVLFQR